MKITLTIEGITKGSDAEGVSEKLIDAFHDASKVSILGVNARVARYEARYYETVTTQTLAKSILERQPSRECTAEFELYIVD